MNSMTPAHRAPALPTTKTVRAASAKLRARLTPAERYSGAMAYLGSLEADDLADFASRFAPSLPPGDVAPDPCAEALTDPAMLLALGWEGADDAMRRAFVHSVIGERREQP